MAIQEQYVLVKKVNGDVGITQNSIEVFSSINASAVANTLVLKEGCVGIGAVTTKKFEVFATPNTDYGINLATGGTASADSVYGSQVAALAFDGSTSTYWESTNTAFPHWLRYDFGEGNTQIINKISVMLALMNTDIPVKNFKIQGSQNGSDWTDLYTGITTSGNTSLQSFIFVNSTGYRYYQIYVIDSWDAGYGYCVIKEFELYQGVASNTTSFTVTPTGKIGIGTDSPIYIIDIRQDADVDSNIRIWNNNNSTNAMVAFYAQSYLAKGGIYAFSSLFGVDIPGQNLRDKLAFYAEGTTPTLALIARGTSSDIQMYTGGYAASNLRLSITSTGNVGIGITPLGRLHLLNSGTDYGLYIQQDGVLAGGKSGLYIYSNTAQINSQLFLIIQDNASSTFAVMQINNDGTGHGLYIRQNGILASGQCGIVIYSNVNQVNSPLFRVTQDGVLSTADVIEIGNSGIGHGVYIHQDGVLATGKHALYVYSNAAQVNSHLVRILMDNAASTYPVLDVTNDGLGNAFEVVQNGNLASNHFAFYIQNNGTPADGAGRCIRLDGCTISSTKNPETDTEAGFIAVNIDGTQGAIPYYALA